MLEHVYPNVRARFRWLRDHEVVYLRDDDADSTPTILPTESERLSARLKRSPREWHKLPGCEVLSKWHES